MAGVKLSKIADIEEEILMFEPERLNFMPTYIVKEPVDKTKEAELNNAELMRVKTISALNRD